MSAGGKLREIERLRAVAVLLVVALHVEAIRSFLPPIAQETWTGVDLFFVISGLVVTRSLLRALPPLEASGSFLEAFDRARGELRRFYVRRFFRITPPAIAMLLFMRAMGTVYPMGWGLPVDFHREAAAFLGGILSYDFSRQGLYNALYWSLSVEEHFYLLLPLMLVTCRTRGARLAACLVVAATSVACRALPPPDVSNPAMYWRTASHLRFDTLMVGVALALVSGGAPRPAIMPPTLVRWVVVPGALLVIACLPGAAPIYPMSHEGFLGVAMLSGLVVFYASLDRGYVLEIPGLSWVLEKLGARSYALYLTHTHAVRLDEAARALWPAYARVVPSGGELRWRQALVTLVAALALAELLHRGVERPLMRIGQRALAGRGEALLGRRARRIAVAAALALALLELRHPVLAALGPPNLALHAPVVASSIADGAATGALTDGQMQEEGGLVTREEDGPWATVDLGRAVELGAVRIYNREDRDQKRPLPLELDVSDDGVRWFRVARRELLFTQSWPWRVACDDLTARYVRLRVAGRGPLGLSEVEIYDEPVMAFVP